MPLPLDIPPIVTEFNVGPLVLTRTIATGTINEYGEHVPGATTTIVLNPVAAYPLSGRDLTWAPEALRSRDWTAFVAVVELRADNGGKLPDRIAYQGQNWQIMRLKNLAPQGSVWYAEAIAEERIV